MQTINAKNGITLIHCFAGCEAKWILTKVGLTFEDLRDVRTKEIKYQIQKQGWVKPKENVWIKVEACWFLNKNGCDGSNYFKQTLDILQRAGVYLNDSKVIENTINVFVDRNNPRVELNIYPLQKRGIFISDNQLEEFKNNNCCECSRPTTCRVLKNALDNKISEDINLVDNMCFKKKTKK